MSSLSTVHSVIVKKYMDPEESLKCRGGTPPCFSAIFTKIDNFYITFYCFLDKKAFLKSGPKVIKLFPCSTQLSTKF